MKNLLLTLHFEAYKKALYFDFLLNLIKLFNRKNNTFAYTKSIIRLKIMKGKIYIILFFILTSFNISAQTKMLTGYKHLVILNIPKNWLQVETNEIPFLIKPDEKNVSDNTYMYVYGLDYETSPDLNLWIEGNNGSLKSEIPEIKISELELKFENLKKDNFLTGRYKAVSYVYPDSKEEVLLVIESKTTIITAVLSAKDNTEFKQYLDSFKELVNSLKINAANLTFEEE